MSPLQPTLPALLTLTHRTRGDGVAQPAIAWCYLAVPFADLSAVRLCGHAIGTSSAGGRNRAYCVAHNGTTREQGQQQLMLLLVIEGQG